MKSLPSHSLRSLAIFGVALLLVSCFAASEESALKIIGGRAVPDTSPAASSAVSLIKVKDGHSFCSGTLVAERLVVTAAHCVAQLSTDEFEVGFGNVASATLLRQSDITRVAVVEKQTFKPEGDAHFPNFDIAWVKLRDPAPAGSKPVEILRDATSLKAGEDILIAGFGLTASQCVLDNEEDCRGVKLEVETRFRDYLNRGRLFSLFRLGPKPGSATCYGDSGGPAYVQKQGVWYLIGATNGVSDALSAESFVDGQPTCEGGSQVYTFVGDYARWIAASANVALHFDEQRNPVGTERVLAQKENKERSFTEWLQYDNHNDPAWSTMQHVVDQAIRGQSDVRKVDYSHLLLNPEDAAAICRAISQYSLMDTRPSRIIENLEPLASMDWVTQFKFSNSRIADFSPLARLPALRELELASNAISAQQVVVPISFASADQFTHLTKLALTDAPAVIDLKGWGNHPSLLEKLSLTAMSLRAQDFAGVHWQGFSQLQELKIAGNQLDSIATLRISQMPSLKTLKLDDNGLASLEGLSSATLEHFEVNNWIARGQIDSVAKLGDLPKLHTLILSSQRLVDVSPLARFTQLQKLFLYDNFIVAIDALSALTNLETLDVSFNAIDRPECPLSPAEICELEPQYESILKDHEESEGGEHASSSELASDTATGAELRQ